jgi:uncharacterized repeat protein (TIGR01451 family)
MKRILIYGAMALSLGAASLVRVAAVQKPRTAPLPNFDKRELGRPPVAELGADRVAAATRLRQSVPGTKIEVDRIFGTPCFITHPNGFLSGAGGVGRGISGPTAQAIPENDPYRTTKAFLQEHRELFGYGAEVLDSARVRRESVTAHNGLKTVVWEQELDGIPVFDSILMSHITRHGELVNVFSQCIPDVVRAANAGMVNRFAAQATPPVSAAQAIVIAANNLGQRVNAPEMSALDPQPSGPAKSQRYTGAPALTESEARLVWLPMDLTTMRLCWETRVSVRSRGETFQSVVDAITGEVLVRRCLTVYISDATYRVYTNDSPTPFSPGFAGPNGGQPPGVNRTTITTNAYDTNASPLGWISDGDNETRGNNVDAHTDWDADDMPDLPRPMGGTNRDFTFPVDPTMSPTNSSAAAVVNLFYWCNWYHDKLWQLGFDEPAGNYQNDNFGRGGLGNDAILADAQDGSGVNNANFTPARDGVPGRVQMYLFDGPTPDRDGDLDQEVVLHELTHGTSGRLVGAGAGLFQLQSGGLGEGWSDFYALALLSEPSDAINGNWAAGAFVSLLQIPGYVDNYYFGARHYPYSTDLTRNPLTFKDIDPAQIDPHVGIPLSPVYQPFTSFDADEVHHQGEVWCVTLWDMRANLIGKYGFAQGNLLTLQLVTDGMKLCPVNPNFLQARDAILQADLVDNGYANFDEIWRAFAKRGMGGSASSPPSSSTVGVQEAYDLPGIAFKSSSTSDVASGNGNGAVDINECTELTVVLINNGRINNSGVQAFLTTTTPGVTISQADSPYPDILPAGMEANLVPFKFYTTPAFLCGTPIKFVLTVQTDQDSRQIKLSVDTGLIATPVRFDQATPLTIPDGNFLGVDSSLNVAGFSGNLAKAIVSIHVRHPSPYDLEIRLIAPDGTTVVLVQNPFSGIFGNDFGTACSPDDARTIFDDKATLTIPGSFPPFAGSYKPQQPLGKLVGKTGSAVNGVWKLHIIDRFFFDTGSLQCWSLQLSPFVCGDGGGDCSTDIALSGSVAPPLLVVSSNATYSLRVDNVGLNTARNVVLTDSLPPGTTYVSAVPSQGLCNQVGGVVTCTIGSIPAGASAFVGVTVRANAVGILTNNASITMTVPDTNPGNNFLSLTSTVLPPTPVVVATEATLISESISPASGGLDVGETVMIDFALQNIGSRPTTNLVATLLNSNGVSGASGAQTYGALLPAGPAVAQRFTFTANGVNGGVVVARLRLTDGAEVLPEVAFTFGLGSAFAITNQSRITLPDQGAATNLYPSTIFLSGIPGTVKKVAVTLYGVQHTFPDDIDVLLVGPRGEAVMLLSDAGGGGSVSGLTLAFEDGGAIIPDSGPLTNGTYRPVDYEPGDALPPGAPASPYAGSLGIFNGGSPNGIWSLYVADDTAGDSGRIANGWSLQITTVDPVNATADLRIGGVVAPSPVALGSNVTYTLSVTNAGPDLAAGIFVTNTLPTNVTFVSAATPSQGFLAQTGSTIIWSVGSLTNLGRASLSFVATALRTGSATNVAVITGDVEDPNAANSRTAIATTITPEADLAVGIVTSPNPVAIGNSFTATITVTNAGPDTAVGISLTNRLPTGLTNVSFTSSLGSCSLSAGQVICNFTRITNGRSAIVTITGRPSRLGAFTNFSAIAVVSPVDRVLSNNTATAITTVTDPFVILVPDGVILLSENYLPRNGGLDVGETVALSFQLRSVGVSNTTALRAALRAAGGVTVPSGAQDYGVVEAGGAAVGRTFSFTAFGTNGGSVVATLDLTDGSNSLGSVTYTLTLSGSIAGRSSGAIPIPDNSRAQPYPAGITFANVAGVVEKVSVTLSNFTHAYPDDVDVLLVGPHGQSVLLMSDAGGSHGVQGVTLRFDDDAGAPLPDSTALTSGIWRPSDYAPSEEFPAPAPTPPYGTNLAVFHHTDPSGVWSLYIQDEAFGDLGSLSQGWSLDITTVGFLNSVISGSPANLSQLTYSGGTARFTVSGEDGAIYMIEASEDFQDWTQLGTVTVIGTSATFEDTSAGSHTQRFYRARSIP